MAEGKKVEQEIGEIEEALSLRAQKPVVQDESTYLDLMDSARFEHLQRVASVFAASKLVPKHFQGNKADCLIACQMAMRLDVDPMMLMQNTYIVSGNPGMEAKLMIALMNSRGPFTGPVQFRLEGEGMKRKCVAYATHGKTGQLCEAECTMELAKAERWIDKDGSKWKTMPDLMLQYRSAAFLARLYCPEVLMGLKTKDELEDIGGVIDVTPEAPLMMPRSVKEATSVTNEKEEAPAESGSSPENYEDEGPPDGQGNVDERTDGGPDKVHPPEGKERPGPRGRRKGSTGGSEAGSGGPGELFGGADPSPEEQEEILKQERGMYGPP